MCIAHYCTLMGNCLGLQYTFAQYTFRQWTVSQPYCHGMADIDHTADSSILDPRLQRQVPTWMASGLPFQSSVPPASLSYPSGVLILPAIPSGKNPPLPSLAPSIRIFRFCRHNSLCHHNSVPFYTCRCRLLPTQASKHNAMRAQLWAYGSLCQLAPQVLCESLRYRPAK